uniref:DUF4346 domain-containing protein n=1 Tax=Polysiphonia infestans TaxID=2006978 RepID=A0A1Z1MEJ7_9FLOR|nr:hypothetical protein [Polysiphonia infestans]ARW64329.1 hypothetical protein [Polysiphonia infestans]
MDNSYFVIRISKQTKIEIYFYNYKTNFKSNNYYPICFIANSCDFQEIINLLNSYAKFTNCSAIHNMYLGREVFKAQVSIQLNQIYIQN